MNIQLTYHVLIVCIQTQNGVSKLRVVFQTQIPISLVTVVISIQHLYMTKYKLEYAINNLILCWWLVFYACTIALTSIPAISVSVLVFENQAT